MSLIWFHRLLIACAIAFCLGFAAWEFVAFQRNGNGWLAVLAAVFAVAGIGLLYYLSRLRAFLKLPAHMD
jgi:hypothetical protein